MTQNKVAGVKVDPAQFAEDPAQAARLVLFHDATTETQQAIAKALTDQKDKNPNAPTAALVTGLILGSPDFQRR
jgi:hypothetical protein